MGSHFVRRSEAGGMLGGGGGGEKKLNKNATCPLNLGGGLILHSETNNYFYIEAKDVKYSVRQRSDSGEDSYCDLSIYDTV